MVCVKRRFVPLLFAIALCFACSKSEKPVAATEPVVDENTPQEGGTVVRRLEADIFSTNPVLEKSKYDRYITYLLYTPLVRLDQNLRPIPALAEKWEISPDGKVYTFHLAPKATYTDGSPIVPFRKVSPSRSSVEPSTAPADARRV